MKNKLILPDRGYNAPKITRALELLSQTSNGFGFALECSSDDKILIYPKFHIYISRNNPITQNDRLDFTYNQVVLTPTIKNDNYFVLGTESGTEEEIVIGTLPEAKFPSTLNNIDYSRITPLGLTRFSFTSKTKDNRRNVSNTLWLDIPFDKLRRK